MAVNIFYKIYNNVNDVNSALCKSYSDNVKASFPGICEANALNFCDNCKNSGASNNLCSCTRIANYSPFERRKQRQIL